MQYSPNMVNPSHEKVSKAMILSNINHKRWTERGGGKTL